MSTVLLEHPSPTSVPGNFAAGGHAGQLTYDSGVTLQRSDSAAPEQRSRIGEIYSYTTVQAKAASFVLALVRLTDGKLVTARIVNAEQELRIGLPVKMVDKKSKESRALFFSLLTK